MKRLFIFWFFLAAAILAKSQQQEVPFTFADRDRIIQTEVKVDALNGRIEQLDEKIDQVDRNLNARMDRLDDKFDTYFTWGFGMVLGAIFALFGFILYDRRTTVAPVRRELDKTIEALRDMGKEDTNIREALKKVALW